MMSAASLASAPSAIGPNADLFRMFGILAAVAFVAGFLGYLAVAQTDMATLQARMTTPAQVSNTAARSPTDDWNRLKAI